MEHTKDPTRNCVRCGQLSEVRTAQRVAEAVHGGDEACGSMRFEQILTLSEVARDLHCSKSQVSNLVNGRIQGVRPLPAIPLGRRRLVRRCTLEAWKSANERALDGDTLLVSPQSEVV
jgi:hypothetical protein